MVIKRMSVWFRACVRRRAGVWECGCGGVLVRNSRQLFFKKKKKTLLDQNVFQFFFNFQFSVFSFWFPVETKKTPEVQGGFFSTVQKKKKHTHTIEKRSIRMVACVRARARGRLGMWAWRCLGAMCRQCIWFFCFIKCVCFLFLVSCFLFTVDSLRLTVYGWQFRVQSLRFKVYGS